MCAKQAACSANLKGWGTAINAYAAEWDNTIMASAVISNLYLPNNIYTGASTKNEVQITSLNPYLGYCADTTNKKAARGRNLPWVGYGGVHGL